MKIFYVAPYATRFPSPSASSIHMARMAEAYAELGHQLTFCTGSGDLSSQNIFDYYGISDKLFDIFSNQSKIPKINRLIYSYNSVREAKIKNADVLISRSVFPCWFAAFFDLDFVYDAHGPIWETNFLEFFLFKNILSAKQFKRMTTNSVSLRSMYKEKGLVPRCEVRVANNGVKTEKEESVRNWPGRTGFLQVGYFGHLYEGRGIDLLLSCADKLCDVDFHFVGGNETDISYWKKIAPSNTFFHGFIKPAQVGNYRAMVDVLVAPYSSSGVRVAGGVSDSVDYMNPIKLIEYLSSFKPIICSDLKAIRDVVSDNVCIFADPDNYIDWIEKISRLRDSPDLRNILEDNTKQFFSDRFSWKSRAKCLIGY